MGIGLEEGYAEFVQYHEQQLRHIGFPEEAWRQVYEKLQPRTIHDIDKGLQVKDGKVVMLKPHQPYSCVYIVPHLWSGDGGAQSFSALDNDIDQPARLVDIMGTHCSNSKSSNSTDEIIQGIVNITGASQDTAKSAYNNAKGDLVLAVHSLSGATDNVDGDKLGDTLNLPKKNTILTFEAFQSAMTEEKSEHELELMYNDYVRKKQEEIGEDGFGTTDKYRWVDDAEEHVITVTIPVPTGTKRGNVISKVTSKHWTFGIMGQAPIIYGNFEGIVRPDECTWYFEKGTDNIIANIQKVDTEEFMWQNLIVGEDKINKGFLNCERRRNLIGAMDQLWYHALTYQAVTPEGTHAHNWYLPPQTVTKISHSKNPNFQLAPFWSCYGGKLITLLWPIKTTRTNETCTLNKHPVLFTGEPDVQREARSWAANPANISKTVPKSFVTQHDNLAPPFCYRASEWSPMEGEVLSESDNMEELTVVTSMKLSDGVKDDLKRQGIVVTDQEIADKYCCYWKEGRADRTGLSNVNSFDFTLTNPIRLNSHIRSTLGNADWWPAGYHLNKELAAILACPPSWDCLWLLRCTESSAASLVTCSPARMARMCENSLNYFAQLYVDSLPLDHCQCSLEFTVVIRNNRCYISDIPAVHKARAPVSEREENYYLVDHFIPRSDGSNFPSAPWSKFLVAFSLREPWPATETKIHHIINDLLYRFVKKTTEAHCYGVQLIITSSLEIKLVGINPSPTYFPSLQHLAGAWKLLYHRPLPVVNGYRTIVNTA